MHVVAFNGSARKNGNTAMMIGYLFEELEKEGISTELVQLSGEHPHGCIACYQCFKNKNRRCVVTDDCINSCIEKMETAEAIVMASPTYIADISTETKALIDRAAMTARANGDLFKRKLGAAIVTQRRAGGVHAFDSINHFFTISQMIVVGSSYWNIGMGREKGEVAEDREGIATMRDLGGNMTWLLKKIHG
ncbi:MAG: flavodoxin family protein [Desulfobulbus sp.]|jgi:multimeric flavodoxin WrbA|uniref:flavodoxin family protein n=1 Tax=Desulfobulbus sp. TaxID=895 RepID=UPI00283E36F6|nr:flavodoxin family protein [Desulfobulbus sp.]MDR2549283.1 flavodoxin family protein [Desulfobulbus sp.]